MSTWNVYGTELNSRLLIGSARYPSPQNMVDAIRESGSQVVTTSLKRQQPNEGGGDEYWQLLKHESLHLLPNTAGCHSAREAVNLAKLSRELFETNWIKLEVIGDDYNLQPDPIETLKAARELMADGFKVFPYITDDLVICQHLRDAGCEVIMPWGAPIGTGQGLVNPKALETLRNRLPDTKLIVDAGIGRPSDAAQVMEMGFDGVLLNTAISCADDPITMARGFKLAVEAGLAGYEAGIMPKNQIAQASTASVGIPFWHQA